MLRTIKGALSAAASAIDRRLDLEREADEPEPPDPGSELAIKKGDALHPLCVACLARRDDVPLPWLEQEAHGRAPKPVECSDDLAFPAITISGNDTPCTHCGSTGPILAVSSRVAASVDRYLKLRSGAADS